ncbi:hypothetical protein SteCoe_20377 [Stentor coeruleus]|uniref:Acyl-coenzyme A oxidase n=1 Tax=Stentor coeruleus TaxID=5963 RepID=A0A1R2BRW4_9CILI|nr:hypothetical protein SteCoe_20377 [Stentor coeruleus]
MVSRLNIIKSHFSFLPHPNALDNFREAKINTSLLQNEYYKPNPEIIYMFIDLIKGNPLFDLNGNLEKPREVQRELIIRQLLFLYPKFYAKFDLSSMINRGHFGLAMSAFDLGLSGRYSVHAILYMETLEFLGTDKHKPLMERSLLLKDYGSFSMTEIGHGSNVAALETTAIYNHSTHEFIINSPTPTSTKYLVGGMANTSTMTVVFAQLIIENVKHGIHAFVIRVRDINHNPVKGVIIGDCGAKAGLNGIDNGFIAFNNLRVPYDSLLDRMSHISPEGKFKSHFKSNEKRFGIMLSGLIGGRTGILGNSELNLRHALTIAIRYGAIRLQFGGDKEQAIITYPTHKYRLMPLLAKCFAARMSFRLIIRLYLERKEEVKANPEGFKVAEMHGLSSVFKYINCKYSQEGIQTCREACGGHGYSAYSNLSRLRCNNDAHYTWDGDNDVLIQQCSRFLLKNIMNFFKGNAVQSKYVSFMTASNVEITAENLDCPKKLIGILEYRAHYYMNKCVAKLQSIANPDPKVVWMNSQVHHMNNLSISFGELVAAKELLEFVYDLKNKCLDTGNEIEKVFKLYVLTILEKEHIGFSDNEHRIIEDKVIYMSELVAKSAVKIIDAIALPDHVLGSVLGCSDGRVYERYMEEVERAPGCYGKPSWVHLIEEMKKAI